MRLGGQTRHCPSTSFDFQAVQTTAATAFAVLRNSMAFAVVLVEGAVVDRGDGSQGP